MIRKAAKEDLNRILEIYAHARAFMKETGNPNQWGDHYPQEERLVQDIEEGILYVYEEDRIKGVFMFRLGEDATYGLIEQGGWLSDAPYGTIHRIASDGSVKGFLGICMEYCLGIISHIRIDTHKDNVIMQKAVAKNGFQKCGIIYTEDGSPRIAYERL